MDSRNRFYCFGCLGRQARGSQRQPTGERQQRVQTSLSKKTTHVHHSPVDGSRPTSPAAPTPTENAVRVEIDLKAQISGDPWCKAFARACSKLTVEQQKRLHTFGASGITELLDRLDHANEDHQAQSHIRRGLKKLGRPLDCAEFCLGLTSPVAGIDPIANNAFGIVQSVLTLAIAICGAEQEFDAQIQAMLDHVSIIARCDDYFASCEHPLQSILEIIVDVYKDLLDFYFEAVAILQSRTFLVKLKMSNLPDIMSSFNSNIEKLNSLIHVETLSLLRTVRDGQDEYFVRSILAGDRQTKEVDYYNALKQRADEACSWITSATDFRKWTQSPGFCVLFGDVGCGKSMTASFVFDFLNRPELAGPLRPIVCAYYCKDDNETNRARSIYRGILSQILSRMETLKARFREWYERNKATNSLSDPTLDDNALRDFIIEILSTLPRRFFLVLDGLDECDQSNRAHLIAFLNLFSRLRSPVNIFLSTRRDEVILSRLPLERMILEMDSSARRDSLIARYLVEQHLSGHSDATKELIVNYLSTNAAGSAIWQSIVVQYVQCTGLASYRTQQISRELHELPTPDGLSELYGKIFHQKIRGGKPNERKLSCALETLAAAKRPLTLDELTYVVTIQYRDGLVDDFSSLEGYLESSTFLLDLIRPFVKTQATDENSSKPVHLIHQSLKELIMRQPPSTWASHKQTSHEGMHERCAMLNKALLDCCIRYLSFKEFKDRELFPQQKLEQIEDMEFLQSSFGIDDDVEEEPTASKRNSAQTETQAFDPNATGFGKFYAYAACYWTEHFKDCTPDTMPSVNDIMTLSQPGSVALRNWVETYKRPFRMSAPQRILDVESVNELVVASYFGPPAFLKSFLRSGLHGVQLPSTSARTAFLWAIQYNNFEAANILLNSEIVGTHLKKGSIVREAMVYWKAADTRGFEANWDDTFTILLGGLFEENLLPELLSWANTILCAAAENGCLPVLECLLERAQKIANLRIIEALLAPNRENGMHQSIGEAAFRGHTDVVRYLMAQQHVDLSTHLCYRSPTSGQTVLHCAAYSGDAEIFRILLAQLPRHLVDQPDATGDTALIVLVFANSEKVEAAKVLLELGKANPNWPEETSYYSPLRTAIRAKSVEMCSLLIEFGADVNAAIEVDNVGCTKLKDTLGDAEVKASILKALIGTSPNV